jgi:hypothetical protein
MNASRNLHFIINGTELRLKKGKSGQARTYARNWGKE